jgi:cytochrome P450
VAVEEFLRACSRVTMAREIAKETCINGTTFRPGELVLLSFPAANRDPAVFPTLTALSSTAPKTVMPFGLGIHR